MIDLIFHEGRKSHEEKHKENCNCDDDRRGTACGSDRNERDSDAVGADGRRCCKDGMGERIRQVVLLQGRRESTGWQEWDGKRYYLNSDGTMKANEWMIDADGSIYYFRSWGGAYKNCNTVINGRSYTFGADSKMQVPSGS